MSGDGVRRGEKERGAPRFSSLWGLACGDYFCGNKGSDARCAPARQGAQPRAGGGVESCAGEVLLWGAVCLAPAAEEPTAGKEEPVGLQSEPGVRRDSRAVEKIVL